MPQTSVGTTGVRILPRNPYRRSAIFYNPSVNVIYVETDEPTTISTSTAGIRIPSLAFRSMDWLADGPDSLTDTWSAISDTGTNTLIWREFVGRGLTTLTLEQAIANIKVAQ